MDKACMQEKIGQIDQQCKNLEDEAIRMKDLISQADRLNKILGELHDTTKRMEQLLSQCEL
jgi:hypothetical protein